MTHCRSASVGFLLLLLATVASGAVAELNSPPRELDPIRVPDDTLLAEQWSLLNWGQPIGSQIHGMVGADIRAVEAWQISRGDGVLVAVIDSGVDYNHPDLINTMWINEDETGNGRSANGIDDDQNGYIDDWRGWDWVDGDNDPMDDPSPLHPLATAFGHGTAVASIIAAEADNAYGMAGVAPNAKILALRVIGAEGIEDADVVDAINYAASMGALVVNLSISNQGRSIPEFLAQAIETHRSILFVLAAGNDGIDLAESAASLCHIDTMNAICVTASDEHDAPAVFDFGRSNFGIPVDVAGPGDHILVAQPLWAVNRRSAGTSPKGVRRQFGFVYAEGTSIAAPHISGVAALIYALAPESRPRDVITAIIGGSTEVPALRETVSAGRRIDAENALMEAAGGRIAGMVIPDQPMDIRRVLAQAQETAPALTILLVVGGALTGAALGAAASRSYRRRPADER